MKIDHLTFKVTGYPAIVYKLDFAFIFDNIFFILS